MQNSLVASFQQSLDWRLLGLQACKRLPSLVQPYGCSVMTFNSNLTLVNLLAEWILFLAENQQVLHFGVTAMS